MISISAKFARCCVSFIGRNARNITDSTVQSSCVVPVIIEDSKLNNIAYMKCLKLKSNINGSFELPLHRSSNLIKEDPIKQHNIIESPKNKLLNEILDILKNDNIISTPTTPHNKATEIQAARLIVIRRKKMKKHKLKKLRKKMKFEWAKVRQRREMRKEKAFQAQLISQIKEAEKFSAEQYVADKIAKANEIPIPRYWKGKRLPQFIIKEKLGLK